MSRQALVQIRPEFVERLTRRADSAHWRRDLFDAGLPQVLDEIDLTGASPAAHAFVVSLARLYDGVVRLEELEAARDELQRPHPWAAGRAPHLVWIVPLFVTAGLVQATNFVVALAVSLVGFGAIALVGLGVMGVTQHRRRAALVNVRRACLEERAALARTLDGALRGPLDVTVGEVRYVVVGPMNEAGRFDE